VDGPFLAMPSELTIHLTTLGGLSLRVTGDAGERSLAKGKPAALIAFLACSPGRRATRERLATLLWADGTSEAARQNLRQTIWYIKRRLGEVLEASDDTIGIASPVVSDRDAFLAAADAGDHGLAVQRYVGPFIPEFAAPGAEEYEEWAIMERRRLSGVFVACAELEARSALAEGRFADAVRLGRQARNELPTEQPGWRLCLESLIAARDTVGVTAELAQLETLIEREEIAPDASLRGLIQAARRFLKGDGSAPVSADPERSAVSFVPDLVGREAEFRRLIDAWDQVGRGRGGTLLLAGAAGLGKSRLLADFEARLRAARARVVSVRAHPGDRGVPSSLVAMLAERMVELPGSMGVAPSSAGVLVALSPRLSETFSGATPDNAEGENALRRRVIALAELVAAVSETKPVAVLIDDLHWADPESVRILAGLRAALDEGEVLTVLASRLPRDVVEALGPVETCQLPPLDLAGVAEFLARLGRLPGEDWTAKFIPALLAATHGIPFELIESLQRLSELGVLRLQDGSWSSDDHTLLLEEVGRGAAVRRRLSALSSAEREVLVRVATLGRPGAVEAFGAAPLAALEHRGFVWSEHGTVGLVHDEIADAALELATTQERVAAHGWAASELRSRRDASLLGVAAMHADRAGDDAQLQALASDHVRARRADGDRRAPELVLAEFLGPSVPPARRAAIAAALPLGLRWPLRFPVLAAAAVVVLALVAALAAGGRGLLPGEDVDAKVYLRVNNYPDSLVELGLVAAPGSRRVVLVAPRVVPRSTVPALRNAQVMRVQSLRGTDRWVGYGAFAGPDGDEIIEVDRRGEVRFLSPSTFDDGVAIPSPDGTLIAFSTGRYDTLTMHMSLAMMDRATGVIRRLTSTRDVDRLAGWSPDGTRLAFSRNHFSGSRGFSVCIIGVDGAGERCDWPEVTEDHYVLGWADATTLLIEAVDSRVVSRLDSRTGATEAIVRDVGQAASVPGLPIVYGRVMDETSGRVRFGFWRADVPGPATFLDLPANITESLTPVSLVERPAAAVEYLARIAITPLSSPVPRDGSQRLFVEGWSADGRQMPVYALRFAARDTAVLSVDSTGVVRPRRDGSSWVVASAGGWRVDSTLVTVGDVETTVLLREDWTGSLERQWRPFGDPFPVITRTPAGPAFDANGDAAYQSGAYSREQFDARDGLGVEFQARLPITFPQWQSLDVGFFGWSGSAEMARWDHRTLSPPAMASAWNCSVTFPNGEGTRALRFFALTSGASLATPDVPAGLYAGEWRRIRVQLFPEGRCGVAIDGVPVSVIAANVPPGVPAALFLQGKSVGSSLLVGPLEVWRGVRRDVRWEEVAGR